MGIFCFCFIWVKNYVSGRCSVYWDFKLSLWKEKQKSSKDPTQLCIGLCTSKCIWSLCESPPCSMFMVLSKVLSGRIAVAVLFCLLNPLVHANILQKPRQFVTHPPSVLPLFLDQMSLTRIELYICILYLPVCSNYGCLTVDFLTTFIIC